MAAAFIKSAIILFEHFYTCNTFGTNEIKQFRYASISYNIPTAD